MTTVACRGSGADMGTKREQTILLTKIRSWRERRAAISVMSGLWDWWRRAREPTPAKSEPESEVDIKEEDGEGEKEIAVEQTEDNDCESEEEDKEYAEIDELIRAAEEEEKEVEKRDVGVPDDSPCKEMNPDYDEVREVSEPLQTATEGDLEKEDEGAAEDKTADDDHDWSDGDEEECNDLETANVPTVTLTLNLKGEEDVVDMEESVTPLYEPPPCLYSADAKLAPVYSTVVKPHTPLREIPLEAAARPVTPVPPPLPEPDWEDFSKKEEKGEEVIWRIGRIKRVKKWIGNSKVNIPNRLSKMLSQDYLCHQCCEQSDVMSSENSYLERTRSLRRRRRAYTRVLKGQSGFEDLRRYIKQGGDFCKELATILQERSEAETQYCKTLVKLSSKLLKATKEGSGTVNSAWHRIAVEMEAQADVHRNFATSLSEDVVKPLKQLVDSQHRIRKSVETAVDKSGKNLAEWRAAETKAKKNSFTCARENEKLRDSVGDQRTRLSTSSLHIPTKVTPEKETAKMETKRRKAEECVKKADVEYYSVCLRAERSRLEWESAVLRGSHCFQVLEEERLRGLKDLATSYLSNFTHIGPKITQISDRLSEPVKGCDLSKDLETVISLKAATEPSQEQILPDFYPEHTTLAMNRERRKQALIKLLELIKSDLERERRGKAGVENLAVALKRTPTFASEDSQQNVQDKLHHMRSMLTYLEAARYKVLCVLSELEGRPRPSHPLADHIHVSRDRQGYQQSVLKVPFWIHNETEITDWVDRGTADGTSVQPDSDFELVTEPQALEKNEQRKEVVQKDEFSSQGSEKDYEPVVRITNNAPTRCRALYNYTANLYDELSLNPGDIINIHDKQPDGWWLGELNGVVGIFPATYVEEIK